MVDVIGDAIENVNEIEDSIPYETEEMISDEEFDAQVEKIAEIQEQEKQEINELSSELKGITAKAKDAIKEIEETTKTKRGRKKTTTSNEYVPNTNENLTPAEITQELYLEFGSFLSKTAEIECDKNIKDVIPTGIKILDAHLGGGFPVGTFTMLVGSPGCGKSMLAGQVLGETQKKFKNALAAYLDSEETVTKVRLQNLGVRNPPIDPYTDITIEKLFKFIEGLCVFKQEKKIMTPAIVAWDSVANTLSKREREAEDINSVIGYKARLLSMLLPKYISKMGQNNISVIAVNQLRDELAMGQFAPAKKLKFLSTGKSIPGGNALVHNAFTLLEMKSKSLILTETTPNKSGKVLGFEGFVTGVKAVKNKLFVPNIECEIVASFNYGFSDFWTSYLFMCENKRMTAGSWSYLASNPDIKFRTKDAHNVYLTNPEFKAAFDREVEESIQCDIIDKYSVSSESEEIASVETLEQNIKLT